MTPPTDAADAAPDHRTPLPPDTAHLDQLRAATERAAAAAEPLGSPHAGAAEALLVRAEQAVEDAGPDLLALSADLHAHHGITAEVGVHGLPTALRARSGSGGPTVAVLAEYDALPGIGHGCGHNVICSAAVGAFLGLHAVLSGGDVPGTALLLGTPDEEGGGGKELMARDGAFDDVDAVVMLHPFSYDAAVQPFLGRRQLRVACTGIAAHASAQPFMGRNALDAVVAGYQGVAMLRQHIPDTDRVHGVITDGGQRPNVVPERAEALYYVRSATPETLADLCRRVEAVVVAGAAM